MSILQSNYRYFFKRSFTILYFCCSEISSIVINELKADKAEKEAAEMKEKLAAKARAARAAQDICDGIVQEGVDEAVRDVAQEQYRYVRPHIWLIGLRSQ